MTELAVLIAAADLLPAMKSRLAGEARELLGFSDVEALRALEVITTKRPAVVVLERRFALTPRGSALVNRIKADPSLVDTQIRVDQHEALPTDAPAASAAPAGPGRQAAAPAGKPAPKPASAQELDYRGTRRAPRHRIGGTCEILVDGNRGTLIDLSVLGAQLVTPTVLKPNQRVRVTLADDNATIRGTATVVWASFEMPKGSSPRYRAGLDFIEPDGAALNAYIHRHAQA